MNRLLSLPQIRLLSLDWYVLCLILIFSIRITFAAFLGLSDDEAYYWQWSRYPSLSYYDHPGMTAWLIHLSTSLLGDTPLAVRLPGLIFHFGAWALFCTLARELFDETTAHVASLLYLLTPIYGFGALLMVPDAPLAFFWLLSLWSIWNFKNQPMAPTLLALSIGLGFLSKYTILLLVPGGLAFLIYENRRLWYERQFLYMLILSGFCSLPVIIWNIQRGWPSFRFHLIERQSGTLSWAREFAFWGSQLALFTPALCLGCLLALALSWLYLHERRWRFVAFISTPILAVFALQALWADFKPHWSAPAYLLPLIAWASTWKLLQLNLRSLVCRRLLVLLWFPLLSFSFLLYIESIYPLVPKLTSSFHLEWKPQWDPTNDFYGWDQLTNYLRSEQSQQSRPPHLAAWRYQLASQMAFATGQKVWRIGGNQDEFTYLQNLDELRGQDVLFVSDNRYPSDPSSEFATCQHQLRFPVYRFGILAREFDIWLCHQFGSPPTNQKKGS